MSNRRRTLLSLGVFALVSIALYQGGAYTYRHRCAVFTCNPLTWAEIQVLAHTAAVQAEPDYRIAEVFVDLPPGTPSPALGPVPFQVQIHYVDPEPENGRYPLHEFTIDTMDQVGAWKEVGTGGLPSLESQQRFDRVRLGPQEVYELTWDRAQQELPESGSRRGRMMLAEFGSARPEPAWFVMYYEERSSISYHIDPQTGAIIDSDRTVLSPVEPSTSATAGPDQP